MLPALDRAPTVCHCLPAAAVAAAAAAPYTLPPPLLTVCAATVDNFLLITSSLALAPLDVNQPLIRINALDRSQNSELSEAALFSLTHTLAPFWQPA